jgi:hypothetical protein
MMQSILQKPSLDDLNDQSQHESSARSNDKSSPEHNPYFSEYSTRDKLANDSIFKTK